MELLGVWIILYEDNFWNTEISFKLLGIRSRSHFFRLTRSLFHIDILTGESCVEQLNLFPWIQTALGRKEVFSLSPHPAYITFKSNCNNLYFFLVWWLWRRVTKLEHLHVICRWIVMPYKFILFPFKH